MLWVSANGRSWDMERPDGPALSGTGAQKINAVTSVGDYLIRLGYTANYREEHLTVWRGPLLLAR